MPRKQITAVSEQPQDEQPQDEQVDQEQAPLLSRHIIVAPGRTLSMRFGTNGGTDVAFSRTDRGTFESEPVCREVADEALTLAGYSAFPEGNNPLQIGNEMGN